MKSSDIKVIKDETVDEQALPEYTPWVQIAGRPMSLSDLNREDGDRLSNVESSVGGLGDILDTQTAEIIAEWSFRDSGALAIKEDADNGLWLSPTGMLAKKSGDTTFAITSSGDATFKGTVVAGSVVTGKIIAESGSDVDWSYIDNVLVTNAQIESLNADKINVGTLTGFTIQTATTGKRLRMLGTPANEYQFLDGSTKVGHLKIDDDGDGGYFAQLYIDHLGPAVEVGSVVGASESVYFNAPFISTSGRAAVGTVKLIGKDADAGLTWSGSNTATWSFNLGDNLARISSDIQPSANATYSLGGRSGSDLYGWGALRLADGGNIGYVRGSSTVPVMYVGYSSIEGYPAAMFNSDCFPLKNDEYYLGLSVAKWARVYSNDYLACPLPAVDNALDKIKATNKPHLLKDKTKGHHGKNRKYFDITDVPEECIVKGKRKDEEDDIEVIRTMGFLFSTIKELAEKVDILEQKLNNK